VRYLSLPPGYLTTTQAAHAAGVTPGTIRDWVRRGILTPCGGTPKAPIFRVADVHAAKHAPKPRRAPAKAA
jgi:hypothetical protein